MQSDVYIIKWSNVYLGRAPGPTVAKWSSVK